MSTDDTSAAAKKALDRRYAEMSFAKKAELIRAVTRAANQMVAGGSAASSP